MRVVIIGGSHAGIAAARRLKKMDANIEVFIIERSNILGYVGSGLNLYLEGIISNLTEAKTYSTTQLSAEGINVYLNTEAITIQNEQKQVIVSSSSEQKAKENISYGYLILAMGSSQYQTDFPLQSSQEMINYKTLPQAKQAMTHLQSAKIVTIIGAGLIGLELANTLAKYQKEIYIVERMDSVLFRYFDKEMTQKLIESFPENVHIFLNNSVEKINLNEQKQEKEVILSNKDTLVCDEVVFAINPRPNVNLVADTLTINQDGAVCTDQYLQTSDPFIYAVGDLISIDFNDSASAMYLPLVTNAYRTGIVAASNILMQEKITFSKGQRTVVSKLFHFYLASSGINEAEALYHGFQTSSITKTYTKRQFFAAEDRFELTLKLVFDQENKQIRGAQFVTNSPEILEMINTISSLITMQASLQQIATMDFYFNPKLSLPLHFLNDLAMEALIV
ncbi:pyridine nucleotide-disulfide oxidoreductase [Tetragenococcus osmophilus]|uniref:Oxidoreductase n=1 Tax=Tetragenococcus osmophilus TaxID=526944 RepID=A0AA37XKD5_9ENTE|nr:FAD-dependent oxidoreductase [Tetragenococcus osmophilus]AYW48619.1 pyridine nucleotide-disulfide oxidoreductase [Tetragenococcus osmophilus]GMA54543.1 oxidoreductase [Alicyclobacillus contaminans]GMA71611.1 oxidoreductase [Tetragenococcus osmophilus]